MGNYSLDKPIAVGHTAEVFRWQDGFVLKLFHTWFPVSAIEHEAMIGRIVYDAGLAVPRIEDELVHLNDRIGLVYEEVSGTSQLKAILSRPWRVRSYGRLLAELHYDIHQRQGIPELPGQRDSLQQKIESAVLLTPTMRNTLLPLLEDLPSGDRLCHGDFHPDNILLGADGPVVIDWIDATNGNPLGDVARTSLLLGGGQPAEKSSRLQLLLNWFRGLFYHAYMTRYRQLSPFDKTEFDRWLLVNAAARLSEQVPEENVLFEFVKRRIADIK